MESASHRLRRRFCDLTAPRRQSLAPCQCMELKIQLCRSPGSRAFSSARSAGVLQGTGYGTVVVQAIQAPFWMKGPLVALILLAFVMSAHADSKALPLALSIKADNTASADLSVLDSRLQSIAFQAFMRRRVVTGVVYNATVPQDLGGLTVQAVRLRSNSLGKYGFSFNEFRIPVGAVVTPKPVRVVLVYRNLGNNSVYSSSIPAGYDSSSVVGVLVYDAANLTASGLPQLTLTAPKDPILIQFNVPGVGDRSRCAAFISSSPGTSPNLTAYSGSCSATHLGDYALLIPRPSSSSDTWKKVVAGIVAGGFGLVLIVLLAILVALLCHRNRIRKMQKMADQGETLQSALIGNSRTPAAAATRTRPTLENDYVV